MGHPPVFQVGARFTVRVSADPVEIPGKGWFDQRFEPGAFDGQLGKTAPVKFWGEIIGHARIIAAEVADDGSSVLFTYEILDLSPGQAGDAESATERS